MPSKKTKKIKKRKYTRNKNKIIDVPLSKDTSKGSRASIGKINYHYQEFNNTFSYFKILLKRNKVFRKLVCIPNVSESWMRALYKILLKMMINIIYYLLDQLIVMSL